MIVLDLEWNRGYDKKQLDEILQIGAVSLDRLGGPITDTFNVYIRPKVHKGLNRPARELPELEAILNAERTFPQAMEEFRQWCGEERVFAVWGGDDVDILRQNCEFWGLPGLKAEVVYDFQAAFSQRVGTRQSVALFRAVEYCALPEVFDYHNALNDALYTALLSAWIREADLEFQEIPGRLRRLVEVRFPPQPIRSFGSFSGERAPLDSRETRRQLCPLCGAVSWVPRWYHWEGARWYGTFRCPEHGWFLCRMTISQRKNGCWRARLAVPPVTLGFLREFYNAAQGTVHTCKRTSHRRRQRKKKRSGSGTAVVGLAGSSTADM